jgi:hypothetical protein
LPAREAHPLQIRRDPLLVLKLDLDVVDGVGSLDVEGNGLANQSLYEDLHATAWALYRVHGTDFSALVHGAGSGAAGGIALVPGAVAAVVSKR